MVQIKLQPEELRASATKYSTGSQTVADVLSTLTAEQAIISANWDGNSFDSFEEQFNELSPKITQFSELLAAIKEQLDNVAQSLEDTDNQLAGR